MECYYKLNKIANALQGLILNAVFPLLRDMCMESIKMKR